MACYSVPMRNFLKLFFVKGHRMYRYTRTNKGIRRHTQINKYTDKKNRFFLLEQITHTAQFYATYFVRMKYTQMYIYIYICHKESSTNCEKRLLLTVFFSEEMTVAGKRVKVEKCGSKETKNFKIYAQYNPLKFGIEKNSKFKCAQIFL